MYNRSLSESIMCLGIFKYEKAIKVTVNLGGKSRLKETVCSDIRTMKMTARVMNMRTNAPFVVTEIRTPAKLRKALIRTIDPEISVKVCCNVRRSPDGKVGFHEYNEYNLVTKKVEKLYIRDSNNGKAISDVKNLVVHSKFTFRIRIRLCDENEIVISNEGYHKKTKGTLKVMYKEFEKTCDEMYRCVSNLMIFLNAKYKTEKIEKNMKPTTIKFAGDTMKTSFYKEDAQGNVSLGRITASRNDKASDEDYGKGMKKHLENTQYALFTKGMEIIRGGFIRFENVKLELVEKCERKLEFKVNDTMNMSVSRGHADGVNRFTWNVTVRVEDLMNTAAIPEEFERIVG